MELRDIEIFLALAEEMHFGRAAQRLRLSQARVSQSIKAQERYYGATLVDRANRRDIRLTPLGQQLVADLRPVHQGLVQARARARRAARRVPSMLRVAVSVGNSADYQELWTTFRTRHPQWELRVRDADARDPLDALRSGDTDVAVVATPIPQPDIRIGPVIGPPHLERRLIWHAESETDQIQALARIIATATRTDNAA